MWVSPRHLLSQVTPLPRFSGEGWGGGQPRQIDFIQIFYIIGGFVILCSLAGTPIGGILGDKPVQWKSERLEKVYEYSQKSYFPNFERFHHPDP
jgi:hypothetical protein